MSDSITFEGLDNLERIILADPGYLSYVTLIDRTQKGQKETQLARIDFTPEQLAPFIAQMQQLEELTLDVDDPEESDDSDDEEDDSPSHDTAQNAFTTPLARTSERQPGSSTAPYLSAPPQPPEPDRKTMLEALCFWIRSNVITNMVDEARRSFRVRLYSAKGSRILATGSFMAFNPRVSEGSSRQRTQEPGISGYSLPPDASIALQTDTALEGAAFAFQNLGHSYVTFNELVLDGVKGMQGIMSRTNQDLSAQLAEARKHEASLMEFIMQQRRVEQDISTQSMELQAQEQRTALARDAIDQLGNTMQALMLARGGNPLLLALTQALQSSPRLAQALERPEVQGLLREPRALDSLAQMLESAAGRLSGAGQPAAFNPMPPSSMFPPYMMGNPQPGWGAPALPPGFQGGYPPQPGAYAPPPPTPPPWGHPGVRYGMPPQAGQQPLQSGGPGSLPFGSGNTIGVHIGQLPQYQPLSAAVQAPAASQATSAQTTGTGNGTGKSPLGGGAAPPGPLNPEPPAGSAAPSA